MQDTELNDTVSLDPMANSDHRASNVRSSWIREKFTRENLWLVHVTCVHETRHCYVYSSDPEKTVTNSKSPLQISFFV